jgi:hypothetical protein
MLSGCSAASHGAMKNFWFPHNRKDRAILARRELCCIRVLDNPSKQEGAMASTRRPAAILAADVRRPAFKAWASQIAQIGKTHFTPPGG